MSFEITERVPGMTDEEVAAAIGAAEAGYDLSDATPEPNPHRRLPEVPLDLVDAIQERATQDGRSPDAVVREALSRYLRSA